jgi:hypothetical protein
VLSVPAGPARVFAGPTALVTAVDGANAGLYELRAWRDGVPQARPGVVDVTAGSVTGIDFVFP